MGCLTRLYPRCTFSIIVLTLILISGCSTAPKVTPPPLTAAEKRIANWYSLIESMRPNNTNEKLVSVNTFFNQLEFIDDIDHWGREDYWATPLETLKTNGGDCEDFTIAKYFTLRELDIPEQSMRLTYVKSLALNQPHMVLTYRQGYETDPLVLDNLINAIVPASQRKDLIPVYSFNTQGLWVAKRRSQGVYAGDKDQIRLWREFLLRIGIQTHDPIETKQ